MREERIKGVFSDEEERAYKGVLHIRLGPQGLA